MWIAYLALRVARPRRRHRDHGHLVELALVAVGGGLAGGGAAAAAAGSAMKGVGPGKGVGGGRGGGRVILAAAQDARAVREVVPTRSAPCKVNEYTGFTSCACSDYCPAWRSV